MLPLYSRVAIIYNPRAGQFRRDRAHALHQVYEHFQTLAPHVVLIPTTAPREAGDLARDAVRNGAGLIIAAGGDGTINEVVDGLANSQVPLGILPAGTANVLAHEIGYRRNLLGAAHQIALCAPVRISLGRILTSSGEARYFLLMAGAGFDAGIIYHLSPGSKERLGKLSYFLGGLRRMGSYLSEFEVETGGVSRRCTFALITKVRNYGGDFEIAAEVNLRDDRFEVVLFEGRNSWRYLRYLVGVATRRLAGTPGVTFNRSDRVALRSLNGDGVYLQADGELIGRLPAVITIVPDALTLLMPGSAQKAKQPGQLFQ